MKRSFKNYLSRSKKTFRLLKMTKDKKILQQRYLKKVLISFIGKVMNDF